MTGRFEETFDRLISGGGEPSHDSYLVLDLGEDLASWFVGIDANCHPCILVESTSIAGKQPSPIKLENLDVQFHVPCKVERTHGITKKTTCNVVRLKSDDLAMRRVFYSVCDTMALMLGNTPRDTDLSKAMKRLAAIFRKMLAPASRTLAGLFGELTVIYRSVLPHELIRDWRTADVDRYDFSSNDLKVEVKSSSVRQRVHEFSYEQCSPPSGTVGLVASVFVERASRGNSIIDLLNLVEMRLPGKLEAIFKLREVVATTLGNAQSQAVEIKFDLALALESVQFFDLNEVPAVRGNIPARVSKVRFTSDLSAMQSVDLVKWSDGTPDLVAYLETYQ